MTVGIVIIATNAYFVLGIRLMRKFLHHYKGEHKIRFYLFSDEDPEPYLPPHFPVTWYYANHKNWVDGTNSKFLSILSVDKSVNYLYYIDADTNITKDFGDWWIGNLVGGEHYANRLWMKETKGYDRNPRSEAYVPTDSHLPQMYYYGAFFGGETGNMQRMCSTLMDWQSKDRTWHYEPAVNDESYINKYFHYNQPQVILTEQFEWEVSDKGGLGETRDPNLDVSIIKEEVAKHRGLLFDIKDGKIIF